MKGIEDWFGEFDLWDLLILGIVFVAYTTIVTWIFNP